MMIFTYNPLYDLFNLEMNFNFGSFYLVLQEIKKSQLFEKYRKHYLETMGLAEIEMMNDIIAERSQLSPINILIDLEHFKVL